MLQWELGCQGSHFLKKELKILTYLLNTIHFFVIKKMVYLCNIEPNKGGKISEVISNLAPSSNKPNQFTNRRKQFRLKRLGFVPFSLRVGSNWKHYLRFSNLCKIHQKTIYEKKSRLCWLVPTFWIRNLIRLGNVH